MDYISFINEDTRPLPTETNNALAVSAKTSTEDLEQFIRHNILLVVKTINEHQIYLSDDSVQAGIVGLIQAVKKYDINKGAVSTYSKYWIRNALYKYMHTELPIYYSKDFLQKKKRVQKILTLAESQDIKKGSAMYDLLLKSHDISAKTIDSVLSSQYDVASFDELENYCSVGEDVEYETIDNIYQEQLFDILGSIIDEELSPIEADVIRRVFGFNGTPESCAQIAKDYGFTKQAANNTKLRALAKIRKNKRFKEMTDGIYL